MLADRGYEDILFSCKTIEEIEDAIKNSTHIVQAEAPGTQDIKVYICNDEKVGVKHLRTWCEQNPISTCLLLISLDGPTAFTKKEAESCDHVIQFFSFKDLSINITKHILVPQHTKIDTLPKINGFTIDKNDLPKLSHTDKVSLYYAFKPGDIVEITRCCGSQQPQKYWRIVDYVNM